MRMWCADCVFWEGSAVEVRDGRSQVGECRRNAPIGVGMLGEQATTELYAHWPMTLPHNWCGEAQPKAVADLLSACEDVLEALDLRGLLTGWDHNPSLVDDLRAAIAKAKGVTACV